MALKRNQTILLQGEKQHPALLEVKPHEIKEYNQARGSQKHISAFEPYQYSLYTWLEMEEIRRAGNIVGKNKPAVMAVRINRRSQIMFCLPIQKTPKLADSNRCLFSHFPKGCRGFWVKQEENMAVEMIRYLTKLPTGIIQALAKKQLWQQMYGTCTCTLDCTDNQGAPEAQHR